MTLARRLLFLIFMSSGHFATSPYVAAQTTRAFRTAANTTVLYETQFFSSTLPLDVTVWLAGKVPSASLLARIQTPVIGVNEDGSPSFPIAEEFPLLVSANSAQGLEFSGELFPGSQYLYDWRFVASDNGHLIWRGHIFWAGGRIEVTTIENVHLTAIDVVPGDFDLDGALSPLDIDLLHEEIRLGSRHTGFDANHDGHVDVGDRDYWVRDLAKTFHGDANFDGVFDTSDLIKIFQSAEYDDAVVQNSIWQTGDWTGDAEFDSGDLLLAFQEGGFEKGPRTKIAAVPEPSTWIMFSLPVLVFVFFGLPNRSLGR
jgi:hypothetical protein